jgi:hypothetical protein
MPRPILSTLLVLAAILPIGCGSDPASSRLKAGQEVMAYGLSAGDQTITFESRDASTSLGITGVNVGSRLRVVADEVPDNKEMGDHAEYRKVTVLVLEGPEKNASGTVTRKAIRPIP